MLLTGETPLSIRAAQHVPRNPAQPTGAKLTFPSQRKVVGYVVAETPLSMCAVPAFLALRRLPRRDPHPAPPRSICSKRGFWLEAGCGVLFVPETPLSTCAAGAPGWRNTQKPRPADVLGGVGAWRTQGGSQIVGWGAECVVKRARCAATRAADGISPQSRVGLVGACW